MQNQIQNQIQAEEQLRKTLMGLSGNNTYKTNYLIEAGAGAGKTHTMVHRIAKQLIDGLCACENMAVITFTNKATEEMRTRLDDILRKQRDIESDPGKKQHLDRLIRAAGRMQVSTIHSFCKTMLESLPFESGLGTEMTFLENEKSFCRAFFERKYREDRSRFAAIEDFGINARHLTSFFSELCAIGDGRISHVDETNTVIINHKSTLVSLMKNLHQSLPPKIKACKEAQELLTNEVQELLDMSAQDFASNDTNAFRLALLVATHKDPLNSFRSGTKAFHEKLDPKNDNYDAQLHNQWSPAQTEWDNARAGAGTAVRELVHSRCMPILLALVEEYKQEKRARHIVSSNDLLTYTRDMLRDNEDARQALHERYRVLYVDEFQDTNPIQAQILFYLTTDEQNFSKDWKQCKPEPGSLFLVGDPKQAIYRFSGADIDIYKEVKDLFLNHCIGQVEHLAINFRSAQEICEFSKKVFAPGQSPVGANETDSVSTKLDGGFYQAAFADMIARKGSCSHAGILRYKLTGSQKEKPTIDADRISAFIKKMVADQVKIGSDNHTVTYADFLILPPKRESVTSYAARLIANGIPVNVTGKQTFNEVEPIRRLLIHLDSLTSHRNDLALGRVLVFCYGVKLPTIRRFIQQAEINSITTVLKDERINELGTAFSAAVPQDEEILALCSILREIKQLRDIARTAPALSVIEKLLDGGYGIWEECNDLTHRHREYAYVQQFLQLMRRSPERDLSAMTALANECGERDVEHELSLTDNSNAVRIMNVHKSKGLEGEIVILPYPTMKSVPPTHHSRHTLNGDQHEYCMYSKNKSFTTVYGQPLYWDTASTSGISSLDREKKYQDAEKIRLLYVAATRAKSMLLVHEATYWKPLAEPKNSDLIGKRLKDETYGEYFKYLMQDTPLPANTTSSPTATLSKPVDTRAVETSLEDRARSHLSQAQYAISPSRLDHQSRIAIKRKDRDDDAPIAVLQPDNSDNSTPNTDEVTAFSPHGPDWGTIVHRVMELAVRAKSFDHASILSFARQAVTETLSDTVLTKGQKKMLFEDPEKIPTNWVDELSSAAAKASAFLEKTDTELRQLLSGARCFPELPFILRETDRDSTLYRHLCDHIKDQNANDKDLDVQGVIDLAIWKDGEWTVVDYKTDRISSEELTDKEAFKGRLRTAYTAQIAAYAQVLERLGKGKTTRAYLCSIPLGGELISLDLPGNTAQKTASESTGSPPDVPQAPVFPETIVQAATPVAHHAAAKLYDNKHFDKTVFGSLSALSNTFDFSLLLNGKCVQLIDKAGNEVTEIQKCRQFVDAVQRWLKETYPNKDCSIDFSNAGNQTLLRRTLKTMHRVMPTEDWNKIEIKWRKI